MSEIDHWASMRLARLSGAGETIDYLFEWLKLNGLTRPAVPMQSQDALHGTGLLSSETSVIGWPAQRSDKLLREQLELIKRQYGPRMREELRRRGYDGIWREMNSGGQPVQNLHIEKLPADAMAFYRCFHCEPVDEWGIYIIVPRVLDYLCYLKVHFKYVQSFTDETLAVCVLFEIFHHEFFHHLVESTAATMEIMSSAYGNPRPVFWEYQARRYEECLGKHPCTPLEEALANAYAYNALSFISRVKTGYVEGVVRLYQSAVREYWHTEPSGYRYASEYAGVGYVGGGAQLLAMLLGSALPYGSEPLLTIARRVFPSGHAAFKSKPEIPTYLVGSVEDLEQLEALIPAPNESYTSLFWPGDSIELDEFIKRKRREQREA